MLHVLLLCAAHLGALPAWEFENPDALKTWTPNAHLANVSVKDGILGADTIDWDPFFACQGLDIPATPWQYVHIRIKASQPGACDLFWSGSQEGQNGGLTEQKKERFPISGTGDWEDVVAFPFWQAEGTIKQLRFDLYANAHFDIDFIRIEEWGDSSQPPTTTFPAQDTTGWNRIQKSSIAWSPRLALPAAQTKWATITATSTESATANLYWGCAEVQGPQRAAIPLRGDGKPHVYNLQMEGVAAWRGTVSALGLELPGKATVQRVELGNDPAGAPDVAVTYLGFENGVNRAGRPARILARLENKGGMSAKGYSVALTLPDGLKLADGEKDKTLPEMRFEERNDVFWQVIAQDAKTYSASLKVQGGNSPEESNVELNFTLAPTAEHVGYVPTPQPVQTDIDVAAYYFPGWESPAKWDPIRGTAPIRKPLLGYYDESNPECVDWQIKWSVENGINVYLVDWYWSKGQRYLEHWFEAYRKARYRDQLKVAIMWANHNAPGSNSREDWRAVTQYWIDNYFNLPSYYRIDGKPAIFLWAPDNLRNDLGSVDAVKEALAESQAMAQKAGYKGIAFVAMGYGFGKSQVDHLSTEGYMGMTTYHEWGAIAPDTSIQKHATYAEVDKTVRAAWEAKQKDAQPLTYYPVVDTGWDSRPWHGESAFAIDGRTPALFRNVLGQAKKFCADNQKKLVILGPTNEWGEGSYIEPNTEFGFGMLEQIREVFAKKPDSGWPINLSPADVGLGPYDYPPRTAVTTWDFDKDAGGWRAMMGVDSFATADGALHFKTASTDPAINCELQGVKAADFSKLVVTMTASAATPREETAQLFWSRGGQSTSEDASVHFKMQVDGAPHTYSVDLRANPRWRGAITLLRFDPANSGDINFGIDHIALEP